MAGPRAARPPAGCARARYKAGRGGGAGWSYARGRWPCGDRPAPNPALVLTEPKPCTPRTEARPGWSAQSCGRPRARSRYLCRCRSLGSRHLCLRRPPKKFVVRSRMAPFICGSGTGKGLAVVMAPPPAATAPRGRLAQCTPPPPPAWAPSSGPAAGNQGRPARVRALVGCRRERGSGEGEREGAQGTHLGYRQARRWQGAETELGKVAGAHGAGGTWMGVGEPVRRLTLTRSVTPVNNGLARKLCL